ncbi:MAG: DUF1588 domain-containing protein [Planctomycetota bacterium]
MFFAFGELVFAASPSKPGNNIPPRFSTLIEDTCQDCHNSDVAEAGLNLETLPWQVADLSNLRRWTNVLERVQSGEMPPSDYGEIDQPQKRKFVSQLDRALTTATQRHQSIHGRGRSRRLNASEFEAMLSNALQTPLSIAELLPEDGRADGFDTVGEALSVSSVQIESIIEAVNVSFDQATELYERPMTRSHRLDFRRSRMMLETYRRGGPHRVEDDGVILFGRELFSHSNLVLPQWSAPYDGIYEIEVIAYAVNSDQPEVLTLRAGGTGHSESQHVPSVILDHFVVPPGDAKNPTKLRWRGRLSRSHYLHLSPESLRPFRFGNNPAGFDKKVSWKGPGILVRHVDVKGPIFDQWPSPSHEVLWPEIKQTPIEGANPNEFPNTHLDQEPQRFAEPKLATRKPSEIKKPLRNNLARFYYDGPRKFGERVVGGEPMHRDQRILDPLRGVRWLQSFDPPQDARRLVRNFLPKVFRVPPDAIRDEDVETYAEIAIDWFSQGASFESAIRTAYTAAICSPRSMYRKDTLPQHVTDEGRLDDQAIIERLNFVLAHGNAPAWLQETNVSSSEERMKVAERLIDASSIDRFLDHFVDQWLDLRQLDFTTPDSKIYPEYDLLLRWSMEEETRGYIRRMLKENLPLIELVDSDWTMLNRRLAQHYGFESLIDSEGLNEVDGMRVRPVNLPEDSVRGGLLTQASTLKLTANGTNTSPVVRGVWVLDRLLDQPPSPPPPGVPAIEPDIRGAVTIRDQLERHRESESCARCHNNIDPPGLALEAFDPIGGLRDRYRVIPERNADARVFHQPKLRPVLYEDGLPVETSGFVENKSFRDVEEYKAILCEDPRSIARAFLCKFVAYSTGAIPTLADRREIEDVLDQCESNGFRMRDVLITLVGSDLFVQK